MPLTVYLRIFQGSLFIVLVLTPQNNSKLSNRSMIVALSHLFRQYFIILNYVYGYAPSHGILSIICVDTVITDTCTRHLAVSEAQRKLPIIQFQLKSSMNKEKLYTRPETSF